MIGIVFLFVLFFLKHFICDFVLQTYSMVEGKGTYGAWAGIQHSLVHGLGTLLLLLCVFSFNPHNLFVAAELALIDFLVHYHVDWAKQNLSKKYTSRDRQFWVWLGFDQFLHLLTYAIIIGLLVI